MTITIDHKAILMFTAGVLLADKVKKPIISFTQKKIDKIKSKLYSEVDSRKTNIINNVYSEVKNRIFGKNEPTIKPEELKSYEREFRADNYIFPTIQDADRARMILRDKCRKNHRVNTHDLYSLIKFGTADGIDANCEQYDYWIYDDLININIIRVAGSFAYLDLPEPFHKVSEGVFKRNETR